MFYIISMMINKETSKTKQSLLDELSIIREDIKDVQFSIQNGNISDVSILKGLQEVETSLLNQIKEF